MITTINFTIISGREGKPTLVRMDAQHGALACTNPGQVLMGESDAACVGRGMLKDAAYMFTQGQPVEFGPEIPREVLR